LSELHYPALATLPVKVVSGTLEAYRTVTLAALRKYSPDPLNTAGSRITGGRYNPPEEFVQAFEMLYLAENTAVAHGEARAITVVGVSGGGV